MGRNEVKIYVGNLPFSVTEQDVRTLFETYGSVSEVKMIMDRETGRPRGFGFVRMDDPGASNAIAQLDRTDYEGRTINVSVAREKQRDGGGRRDDYRRAWNDR